MVDQTLRRHRITDDHREPGAHDPGFLETDRFTGGPEVFGVVDVDAGDDRAVTVESVYGVEPTPQANLQNHQIEGCMRQQPGNDQRREFEVRQPDVTTRLLHGLEVGQQLACRDHLPVDAAAFFKMHEVRLGVQADTITSRQRNGFEHRASGAFAVGTGHRNHRNVERQAQALLDAQRPIQRHVDVLRVQALAAR